MRGILSALFLTNIHRTLLSMPTFIFRFTCALLFTLTLTPTFAQQRLPVKQLNIGIHVIQAEIAATEAQRQLGLMNRKVMGSNEGMMFIFDRPNAYCMWMKNTLIPLSVAFINSEGVIVNIEEMQPKTEVNHCASKPALYALEMNAGWFKRKSIQAGNKISGLATP